MRVKNPATISEQIEKLKQRGCIIEDMKFAESTLANINYYRLVHYFAPFLDGKKYIEGTSFNRIYHIYEFDRKLRMLILSVLEQIEISLRAYVSNYHAAKYGALGYFNESSFNINHNHAAFIAKIKRSIESCEDFGFVRHHIEKYNSNFPIWVIMELFSFGTLCYFFCDLHTTDKKEISERYFGRNHTVVENWLLCLLDLRNKCAHYNRLYGCSFELKPKTTQDMVYEFGTTLFDYCLILKFLDKDTDYWQSHFMPNLSALMEENNEYIDHVHIGFPAGWSEMLSR